MSVDNCTMLAFFFWSSMISPVFSIVRFYFIGFILSQNVSAPCITTAIICNYLLQNVKLHRNTFHFSVCKMCEIKFHKFKFFCFGGLVEELGERESGSLRISDSLHQSKCDNSFRLVSRNLIGRESAKCSDSHKLRGILAII